MDIVQNSNKASVVSDSIYAHMVWGKCFIMSSCTFVWVKTELPAVECLHKFNLKVSFPTPNKDLLWQVH